MKNLRSTKSKKTRLASQTEADTPAKNINVNKSTERKRTQEQVRISETRYRRLFESARDGILILDDVARKITDANPFMTELIGYTRDELLGKELWEIGLMKDAEASLKAYEELQEKGYIRYEDLPLETTEGKRREVEFISNVYRENGHQVIQCNIRDITERKRAEEERDRFFTLSMDMLCIANLDGFFQRVNPAFEKILGYKAEEILFTPISTFLHPADQLALITEYASLATGRPTINLENRWRCADGSYRWVAWSYFPVVEEGIAYGVGRDVTERKRAEEELEESNQRVADILESITDGFFTLDHEWRFAYLNPQAEQLLQRTRGELFGKSVWDEFPKAVGSVFEEQYRKAVAEQIAVNFEAFYAPLDCWFEVRAYPLKDGLSIYFLNINERKFTDALLEGQRHGLELLARGATTTEVLESLIRTVEKQSPDAVASILLLDTDGIHLRHGAAPNLPEEYNRALDGLAFGPNVSTCGIVADNAEVVFTPDIENDPCWRDLKHVLLAFGLKAAWSMPILSNTGKVLATFGMYFRQSRQPTAQEQQSIKMLGQTAAIAIAHLRAEEALRRSEIRYRRLFESARDGILILDDVARKITDANPFMTELIGYTRDELLGKELWEIGLMKDAEASLKAYEELQEKGYIRYEDLPLETTEGKRREVEFISNVYRENGHQVIQCNIRDITERKRAEEAMRQSEERFRLLVEGVRDYAIFMLDPDGHIVSWNPGVKRVLGYEDAEFTGQPVSIIYTPEDIKEGAPERELKTAAAEGRAEVEGWRVRSDGTKFWSSGVIESLQDETGSLRGFSKVMRDITERRAAEERVTHDAFHDALTGLPNRALFVEHLKRAIAYTERYEKYLFAVLFIDLDRFKSINDSFGHVIGDHLLIATSRKLEKTLRPEDVVARLGGDEFTILLNDIHSTGDAIRVANRIHHELRLPFHLNGNDVSTTASIGIALSTQGYTETEEVLRDADTAMYRAKALGHGRHEIFDPSMHASIMALLKLEMDLKLAVKREEFRIHYQPIVSLEDNRITGFEALVRWQHPERGLVLPDEFIPIAEETGLIIPIGRWVLNEACRQVRQWQNQVGPDLPLSINVNLSGKQFSQANLAGQIGSALEQTGLDARNLKLEITESALIEKTEAATEMLGQLRALGVKLHIDDFGTGYSSLSILHRFPVDVLKIDRSFVGRMGIGGENSKIVETIVHLAHGLGMEVTAEGVETYQQLSKLRELDCEYGQGYFFSKAVNSEAARRMIAA